MGVTVISFTSICEMSREDNIHRSSAVQCIKAETALDLDEYIHKFHEQKCPTKKISRTMWALTSNPKEY
ncbi:hypothetical protein N7501_005814 [Penicillium viridicatum]|nr:hypothetical protein N7501_005814 [Penicillium viridicatum]